MESPEKLYVDVTDNPNDVWLRAFRQPFKKCGIEYIRTDAFIEKACQWIKDNHEDIYIRYLRGCNSDDEILLFKEYMEGE